MVQLIIFFGGVGGVQGGVGVGTEMNLSHLTFRKFSQQPKCLGVTKEMGLLLMACTSFADQIQAAIVVLCFHLDGRNIRFTLENCLIPHSPICFSVFSNITLFFTHISKIPVQSIPTKILFPVCWVSQEE